MVVDDDCTGLVLFYGPDVCRNTSSVLSVQNWCGFDVDLLARAENLRRQAGMIAIILARRCVEAGEEQSIDLIAKF